MKNEKAKKNHGFPGKVEKVKENNIIGLEKEDFQNFLYHSIKSNNTDAFNHFHHPRRKKPVKRGQLGWLHSPPGSPRSSPGLENEPPCVVARLTTLEKHSVYFRTTKPIATSRQHRATIWPAVDKGGQLNE